MRPVLTGVLLFNAAVSLGRVVAVAPWLMAMAELAGSLLSMIAGYRLLRVFPFDLADSPISELGLRALFILSVAGALLGAMLAADRLVAAVGGDDDQY